MLLPELDFDQGFKRHSPQPLFWLQYQGFGMSDIAIVIVYSAFACHNDHEILILISSCYWYLFGILASYGVDGCAYL